MVEANWKSAPGPSDVAAYNSKRSAFQQAGTFANQNFYDPTSEGSFELKSRLYSDPAAYSFAINDWVSSWRSNTTNVPNSNFKNELDYIQFLLRASGLSTEKGGLSRGILTAKDLTGLKTASQIALANGIGFKDVMLSIYESKQATGAAANAPKYSKQISTSLKLIDLGDAQNKLSTAYFNMFGAYPTEENIKQFKTYWNAEVRKQEATTTSAQVVKKGQKIAVGKQKGTGIETTSRTVTKGLGFTEDEQAQALANYLGKQFNVDVTKLDQNFGGAVKKLYDGISQIYRDNFLEVPAFSSIASTVKDLLTTTDETSYGVKLDAVKQSIRDKAAKFYPALADDLKRGIDVSETADVYWSILGKKWGSTSIESLKRDKEATALVQQALNYRDEKGNVRILDINEFTAATQRSKKWLNGPEGLAAFGNVGDKIIAAMGGGR